MVMIKSLYLKNQFYSMKKIFSLFLLFLCFDTVCLSQSNYVVEPELQRIIDECHEEELSVVIVLKSQVEQSSIREKVAACRDRKVKQKTVVNELKSYSRESQASLLAFLQNEEKKGNVSDISSLWISNSITCKAKCDVVKEIASRSDVAMIGLDKELQMLCNAVEENMFQPVVAERGSSAYPHVVQVGAPKVWDLGYTGKNVVVAILDSGINDEHCDLRNHMWQGYADTDGDGDADDVIHGWNFTANDSNIKDEYGHGTHCAGIVCGDGTIGNITGVAPDAMVMAVKIISKAGAGSPTNMIKGVQFAIENGANILSISSGFKAGQIDKATKEKLRRTFVAALESGVVAFVAAGNDGNKYGAPDNVDFPAACPPPYLHSSQQANAGGLSSVICVGAVNSNDEYASFSSQGPSTWQGTEWNDYLYDDDNIGLIRPDICAPGEWIYSLKHDSNDKYKVNSGTSQATPCVAGVAALMLEKNSNLTPADICRIMENTAKQLTETKSNFTGSGRVDALNAVNAVEAANEKPYVRVTSFSPEILTQGNGRELTVVVENSGKAKTSDNTKITISVDDDYIAIKEKEQNIGSIDADSSKEIIFEIDVHEDAPKGHIVYASIVVSDGIYSWNDKITLEINSYARITSELQGVTRIDAGKDITVDVKIINNGTAATTAETTLVLESNSPYVTFIKDEAVVGTLAVGESVTVPFSFNVSNEIVDNSNVRFDLYAVPNNYTDIKDMIYEFEVGFDDYGYLEDGFNGWTTFDASDNGHSHPWWHSSESVAHRMENAGKPLSGKGHLMSEAYCMASLVESEIPIDNYLVSPKIKATANSKICFKARVHSSVFYGEHFGVAVSEKNPDDASDFTTIKEWTINKEDGTDWIEYVVDLSAYDGKDIYVAIRHFFTKEQWSELDNGFYVYALHVDDVELTDIIDVSDSFRYENYSSFLLRINSAPLSAPANLVATVLDKNSASLSWDGVDNAQSYNIYRNGMFIKNVSQTSYVDTGLLSNTTYSYTVAAVANDKEHTHSHEVTAITPQEEYIVSIKTLTPDVLEIGENTLSITMINDGKYNQESRSTVVLSTENPYVTVISGGININALNKGAEVTKDFVISVDENIPADSRVEFNLNIAQKFEPYRVWNHTFVLAYGTGLGINQPDADEVTVWVRDGNLYICNTTESAVEVYDVDGRCVFDIDACIGNTLLLNACSLRKGLYIIKVIQPDGVTYHKVML